MVDQDKTVHSCKIEKKKRSGLRLDVERGFSHPYIIMLQCSYNCKFKVIML